MLRDLISLFFPPYCLACREVLAKREQWLCTACISELPQTSYHLEADNPVAQKLYGRVPTMYAMAFYRFRKGSKVQELVHQLKYGNKPAIGEALGRRYGSLLGKRHWASNKLSQRGYNQSDYFAKGLSASLAIPWHDQCLKRGKDTFTQTKHGRIERLQNLAHAFYVADSQVVRGKHVLLVDDVITTGATLEACALSLLGAGAREISIATIGVAE